MHILADASLPALDVAFPAPFVVSTFHSKDEVPELLTNQDVLLCRSTLKVNQALLAGHTLRFVATASSGTDHIDHHYLQANRIGLLDAKGCNATAVADYVVASVAYLDQQGHLNGKQVGIIGMGMVGSKVDARLRACNFEVVTYDPPKAMHDPDFHSCAQQDLFACDILCLHANLHAGLHSTENLLDAAFLARLKAGCILINAARGGIVEEQALLATKQALIYCTDVYLHEPRIDKRILEYATLCTPHIAGHSVEAKFGAVVLLSKQLHHLAKLTPPPVALPENTDAVVCTKATAWQHQVLRLYNPIHDTLHLKQAKDTPAAFLALREHHHRHDFPPTGSTC